MFRLIENWRHSDVITVLEDSISPKCSSRKCCNGNSKGSILKILLLNKFRYIFRKSHQIWLSYLSLPELWAKNLKVGAEHPPGRIGLKKFYKNLWFLRFLWWLEPLCNLTPSLKCFHEADQFLRPAQENESKNWKHSSRPPLFYHSSANWRCHRSAGPMYTTKHFNWMSWRRNYSLSSAGNPAIQISYTLLSNAQRGENENTSLVARASIHYYMFEWIKQKYRARSHCSHQAINENPQHSDLADQWRLHLPLFSEDFRWKKQCRGFSLALSHLAVIASFFTTTCTPYDQNANQNELQSCYLTRVSALDPEESALLSINIVSISFPSSVSTFALLPL